MTEINGGENPILRIFFDCAELRCHPFTALSSVYLTLDSGAWIFNEVFPHLLRSISLLFKMKIFFCSEMLISHFRWLLLWNIKIFRKMNCKIILNCNLSVEYKVGERKIFILLIIYEAWRSRVDYKVGCDFYLLLWLFYLTLICVFN